MIPLIPLLPLFTLDYILDKENRGKKVLQKQEDSLKTLNLPLDICSGDLPAYVDIGLNEYLNGQGRVIYTPIQKRSAYQTEFMKAWRAGEDTNILTGARHSSQIKYFLEKGVKDPAIVDLAHIHAELLEKDPEKFYNILYQNKRKENIIQIASLLSGAATTASILSPAIYYLVKYSSIAF